MFEGKYKKSKERILRKKKARFRRAARYAERAEVAAAEEKWRQAMQRGVETERRFFAAFREQNSMLPRWFFGVRVGTSVDDANGIDAFAVTNRGEVPIQIKSSRAGLQKFLSVPHSQFILVVVVPSHFSAHDIVKKTTDLLEPVWYRRGGKKQKGSPSV